MFRITLIFLLFASLHSITVAGWFKERCAKTFGRTFMQVWYRFLYNSVSGITAAIAIFFIMQTPDTVLWTGPAWFRWSMHVIQFAGFIFGGLSFRYLDSREFMGFRQVWRYLRNGEVAGNFEGMSEKGLVTTGVYGIVRHPLYVAGIIIFTFSPDITVNGLTITVLADLYFLFGMLIEELRFLRIFGDEYAEYMKRVPRVIPRFIDRNR